MPLIHKKLVRPLDVLVVVAISRILMLIVGRIVDESVVALIVLAPIVVDVTAHTPVDVTVAKRIVQRRYVQHVVQRAKLEILVVH